MGRNRFEELFEFEEPAIRKVILNVLDIEQENISRERPRVKEPIDKVITAIAEHEVKNEGQ